MPDFEAILPKGPYLPCVSMAGRALLAGYPRFEKTLRDTLFNFLENMNLEPWFTFVSVFLSQSTQYGEIMGMVGMCMWMMAVCTSVPASVFPRFLTITWKSIHSIHLTLHRCVKMLVSDHYLQTYHSIYFKLCVETYWWSFQKWLKFGLHCPNCGPLVVWKFLKLVIPDCSLMVC